MHMKTYLTPEVAKQLAIDLVAARAAAGLVIASTRKQFRAAVVAVVYGAFSKVSA
jgi:hypothetical protein